MDIGPGPQDSGVGADETPRTARKGVARGRPGQVEFIAITAGAGLVGVWVGGYKGPILGVIAGVIAFVLSSIAITVESRNARAAGLRTDRATDQVAAGVSLKMQQAVWALAHTDAWWNQAGRAMEAAAAAGAVWPEAAWRLVEQARRREVMTRAG